jgi:hypothetical protein
LSFNTVLFCTRPATFSDSTIKLWFLEIAMVLIFKEWGKFQKPEFYCAVLKGCWSYTKIVQYWKTKLSN